MKRALANELQSRGPPTNPWRLSAMASPMCPPLALPHWLMTLCLHRRLDVLLKWLMDPQEVRHACAHVARASTCALLSVCPHRPAGSMCTRPLSPCPHLQWAPPLLGNLLRHSHQHGCRTWRLGAEGRGDLVPSFQRLYHPPPARAGWQASSSAEEGGQDTHESTGASSSDAATSESECPTQQCVNFERDIFIEPPITTSC